MKWIIRRVHDGHLIPRGMGVAYYDVTWRNAVVVLMPFNLVIGLAYRAFNWMKAGLYLGKPTPQWMTGFKEGFIDGRAFGRREAFTELTAANETLHHSSHKEN